MKSSSSSSTSVTKNPKIIKVDLEGNVYCNHDMVAIQRVAGRRSARVGEKFYGCPLWPRMDCKFFLWKEDVAKVLKQESNYTEIEQNPFTLEKLKVEYLEFQNKLFVEENKSLKDENKRLKEDLLLPKSKSNWGVTHVLGFLVVVMAIWLVLCH
ncbi:hypothetical protein QVD17_13807 [Tagetes erecta]|uniref:GRF-type domain-containing protein n=1 Tax=Tagetes erecta TaxID=13708 RepID=A0AAD8L0I3_TARER|nr:hypothetical protein QVD17_13807 [Tagetes erecta]